MKRTSYHSPRVNGVLMHLHYSRELIEIDLSVTFNWDLGMDQLGIGLVLGVGVGVRYELGLG